MLCCKISLFYFFYDFNVRLSSLSFSISCNLKRKRNFSISIDDHKSVRPFGNPKTKKICDLLSRCRIAVRYLIYQFKMKVKHVHVDYRHYKFEVNHSCTTIYDGIYVQSYVIIFVNVVLFTALKFFVEQVLIRVYQRCIKKKRPPKVTEHEMTKVEYAKNVKCIENGDVENVLNKIIVEEKLAIESVNTEPNIPASQSEINVAPVDVKQDTKVRQLVDGEVLENQNAETTEKPARRSYDQIFDNPHYSVMCEYGQPKIGLLTITGHLTWSQFFTVFFERGSQTPPYRLLLFSSYLGHRFCHDCAKCSDILQFVIVDNLSKFLCGCSEFKLSHIFDFAERLRL